MAGSNTALGLPVPPLGHRNSMLPGTGSPPFSSTSVLLPKVLPASRWPSGPTSPMKVSLKTNSVLVSAALPRDSSPEMGMEYMPSAPVQPEVRLNSASHASALSTSQPSGAAVRVRPSPAWNPNTKESRPIPRINALRFPALPAILLRFRTGMTLPPVKYDQPNLPTTNWPGWFLPDKWTLLP